MNSASSSDAISLARVKAQADEAADWKPVVRFRQEVLGGSLLRPLGVELWLRENDLPMAEWKTGLAQEVFQFVAGRPKIRKKSDRLRLTVTWVPRPKARDPQLKTATARVSMDIPDRPLTWLYGLAYWLSRLHEWDAARAAGWVLTGQIPPPLRWKISMKDYPGEYAVSRVVLDLSPNMTAKEVAKLYAEARRVLPCWQPQTGKEPETELGGLLSFVMENLDLTWPEVTDAWNERHRRQFPRWEALRRTAQRHHLRVYRKPMPRRSRRSDR